MNTSYAINTIALLYAIGFILSVIYHAWKLSEGNTLRWTEEEEFVLIGVKILLWFLWSPLVVAVITFLRLVSVMQHARKLNQQRHKGEK